MKQILVPVGKWRRRYAFLPVYRIGEVKIIDGVKFLEKTKFLFENYWEQVIFNMKREVTYVLMSDAEYYAQWMPTMCEHYEARFDGEADVFDRSLFAYDAERSDDESSAYEKAYTLCMQGYTPAEAVAAMDGTSLADWYKAKLASHLSKMPNPLVDRTRLVDFILHMSNTFLPDCEINIADHVSVLKNPPAFVSDRIMMMQLQGTFKVVAKDNGYELSALVNNQAKTYTYVI